MTKKEQGLLEQASSEIKYLRSQNQQMSARLDMFDKMMLLFHTPPAFPGQGMSPDITWEIDKYVEKETRAYSAGDSSQNADPSPSDYLSEKNMVHKDNFAPLSPGGE